MKHYIFMKEARKEAYKAYLKNEVPVGAIIVKDDEIIARAHNLRETLKDPTAHAEVLAIKNASEVLGGWRLINCIMYVTMEPCPMCAGAIIQSRIEKVIIGSKDKKSGACGSRVNLTRENLFNHNVEILFGISEEKCSRLVKRFFKKLRNR